MKFSLATLGLAASAAAMSVTYDEGYDDPSRSMRSVSCSDGQNGLAEKYPTQGSLPNFPSIGGFPGITWGSGLCGTCHKITYHGQSIFVLAMDSSSNSFNIGKEAMDKLTNNQAVVLGSIDAEVANAKPSDCNM